VLGAAFVVRAGGDMAREGGNALSWVSPLAWAQQTGPFVLDRGWPLALYVPLALVAAGAAYALAARRDLGASLFTARPGAARAHPRLGTPWGLALRLQRASIIGWTIALGLTGLVNGAYADGLLDATADLPDVFTDLFGEADILGGYLSYMATFIAYLVAAFAILAVQGVRNDETGGRADPVLATPVGRLAWLGANMTVTATAAVVISALVGAATGAGTALVTGDAGYIGELVVAHLNQVPAIWVVLGIAVLCYGALPRAIPATWAVVGYGLIVGTFGPVLNLPQFVLELSPFGHRAPYPLEAIRWVPLLILTALAAAATAAGLVSFRRRDIDGT
jgi:ABC-2 type transport system permease protein